MKKMKDEIDQKDDEIMNYEKQMQDLKNEMEQIEKGSEDFKMSKILKQINENVVCDESKLWQIVKI